MNFRRLAEHYFQLDRRINSEKNEGKRPIYEISDLLLKAQRRWIWKIENWNFLSINRSASTPHALVQLDVSSLWKREKRLYPPSRSRRADQRCRIFGTNLGGNQEPGEQNCRPRYRNDWKWNRRRSNWSRNRCRTSGKLPRRTIAGVLAASTASAAGSDGAAAAARTAARASAAATGTAQLTDWSWKLIWTGSI